MIKIMKVEMDVLIADLSVLKIVLIVMLIFNVWNAKITLKYKMINLFQFVEMELLLKDLKYVMTVMIFNMMDVTNVNYLVKKIVRSAIVKFV